MNTRAELPTPPPETKEVPNVIDANETSPHDRIEAAARMRGAKEARAARRKQARELVAQDRQTTSVEELIDRYKQEESDLKTRRDQLTEQDTSLEHELEVVREKLAHVERVKDADDALKQAEALAETPETPMADVIEPSVFDPQEAPSLLSRFNSWLRGTGRPEQSTLSTSAYAETQTISAKKSRDANRSAEQIKIADRALEGNRRALDAERSALTTAEAKLAQASFLTRWFYQDQVSKLQESIRFREAAIAAREKQTGQQEAA